MTPQARRLIAVLVAAAAGMFLVRRRPVKGPKTDGAWRPVEH